MSIKSKSTARFEGLTRIVVEVARIFGVESGELRISY